MESTKKADQLTDTSSQISNDSESSDTPITDESIEYSEEELKKAEEYKTQGN